MMAHDDDEAWFAPRTRPGQRWAQPVTRQGWAVGIGYGLLIAVAGILFTINLIAGSAVAIAGTAAFVWVLSKKTQRPPGDD